MFHLRLDRWILLAAFAAPAPEMILAPGEPIRARWSDGRQAVLMDEVLPVAPFRVRMTMNGSSCAETPPARCMLESPTRFRKMFYVWEKHPDAQAVGRMLEALNAQTGAPEGPWAGQFLATQDTQVNWRQLGLFNASREDLRIQIQCDRFDWLPADAGGATLEQVHVPAWITDFEVPVGDFDIPGVEDNSAIGHYTTAAKRVRLRRLNEGAYEVEGMATFLSTVTHHGTLLRGYTTSFFFDREVFASHPRRKIPKEEYVNPGCEAEFTVSFSDFFAQNNSLRAMPVTTDWDPARARPVRYDRRDPQLHTEPWLVQMGAAR